MTNSERCSKKLRKRSTKRRKTSALDLYVIFSITALVVYTIVEQTLSLRTGYERSTLTTCFYAAFGGEILSAALIKIFKLTKETKIIKNVYSGTEYENDIEDAIDGIEGGQG